MKKICKECEKEFYAKTCENNRGNANFCSRRCSAKFNNKNRIKTDQTCIYCSSTFLSVNIKALYCSVKCKAQSYRNDPDKTRPHKSTLSLRIRKVILRGTGECFNCSWDKTVCDIHHIIPKSKGGSDDFNNLSVLCPNCHRMAHAGLIVSMATVASRIGLYLQPNH